MQTQDKQNQTVKIVFVGPPSSGKSCIVSGYKDQYITTIGVDCSKHTYEIQGKEITFQLWDISASMTFNNKNLQHVKIGQIVACVFSVNDSGSFSDMQVLAERLLEEDRMRYDAKVVIVGTKTDIDRQVNELDVITAAQILRGDSVNSVNTYFQISTKADSKATQNLCRGLYQVYKDKTIKTVSQLSQGYKYQQPAPHEQQKIQNVQIAPQPVPKSSSPSAFTKFYKIVLMGNQDTGKSSILGQFIRQQMPSQHIPTIGVDFGTKIIPVQGQLVKAQIWDTAGLKKFKTIISSYIKGCQAMILVYDCSNYNTFTNLSQHIQLVNLHSINPNNICKIIVANKIDKQRKVSRQQGQQFAKKLGYQYIQVSALQYINIDEIFNIAADRLIKNQKSIN